MKDNQPSSHNLCHRNHNASFFTPFSKYHPMLLTWIRFMFSKHNYFIRIRFWLAISPLDFNAEFCHVKFKLLHWASTY